jgi:hypothetical protein
VFFFPTFYTFREALSHSGGREPWALAGWIRRGWATYMTNWPRDWLNSWALWLPSHALIYGCCPVHLRMPAIAGVSFGYVGLLSFTRGKLDDGHMPPLAGPLEAPASEAASETNLVRKVTASGDVVCQR